MAICRNMSAGYVIEAVEDVPLAATSKKGRCQMWDMLSNKE